MKHSLIALALFTTPAFAQDGPQIGNCYPYSEITKQLSAYGETTTGPALTPIGSAVEVFISPMGSLSVVEVSATGLACYRAFNVGAVEHGNGWGGKPKNMGPS